MGAIVEELALVLFNSGRIDWIEDARQEYVLLHYPMIVIKIVKDHNHQEEEDFLLLPPLQ